MYIECKGKFSPDFIYLVEQLFQSISAELEPINNSDMRRIIIFAGKGDWFSVTKGTLNILYEEFRYFPMVNIGSDLLFIEQSCQKVAK